MLNDTNYCRESRFLQIIMAIATPPYFRRRKTRRYTDFENHQVTSAQRNKPNNCAPTHREATKAHASDSYLRSTNTMRSRRKFKKGSHASEIAALQRDFQSHSLPWARYLRNLRCQNQRKSKRSHVHRKMAAQYSAASKRFWTSIGLPMPRDG